MLVTNRNAVQKVLENLKREPRRVRLEINNDKMVTAKNEIENKNRVYIVEYLSKSNQVFLSGITTDHYYNIRDEIKAKTAKRE